LTTTMTQQQGIVTSERNASQADLRADFRGARFVLAAGHFDYFGGAERQAVLLARELISEYQADVKFLGWGGDGVFADHIRLAGAVPVVFPFHLEERGLRQKLALLSMAKFLRREMRPDYLLPFVGPHCKVVGAIWRLTGARFCWWNQRDEGRGIHGTRFERRLMRTLPAIVSNSWEGHEFLMRKFGLKSEQIRVINNGVVIPEAVDGLAWRRANGIADDQLVLLMLANLTRFKDHATLLRAFAQVRTTEVGQRCQLVLAGSPGDASESIKALAFDLGLGGFLRLTGAVRDTTEVLAAADLVVHSSMTEGCPNGALEAMALGKCVLGTDISGMRQALGEQNRERFLAPARDAGRLAELILQHLECADLRVAAGAENRSRIEREFSVAGMARQVLLTIRERRLPRR
jgi:glycosyltransferase involved in cell wall biosynthesis